MAVACGNCGAQNPEGNQFCQACGTPLAPGLAPVMAAPPSSIASPPPGSIAGPPPGSIPGPPQGPYASPYMAAPSASAPVHRAPWMIIIAAVVALIVIMSGLGTGIAVLASRTGNQNKTPTSNIQQGLPSPTPAGSPSPIPSPVFSSPSPTPTGGNVVSNAGFSVTVPSGWTVESKDDETVTLLDPSGRGSLTIGAGPSSPAQTAQQNKDTLTSFFTDKYPDTKVCPSSQTTNGSLNGANGIFWELCFTLTSGSQSAPAVAPLFAGANADGSVYYAVMLFTTVDNHDAFIAAARPILLSINWKLK